MLKIGFDAKRFFWNSTGLGNHSRSTVHGLARFHSDTLAIHLYSPKVNQKRLDQDPFRDRYQIHTPRPSFARLGWREWGVVRQLREDRLNLFHGLSAELPLGIEKTSIVPVVTIHDLVAELQPRLFPMIDGQVYRMKMRSAVHRARLVLVTSDATRQSVLELYGKNPAQVKTLYQSPAEVFLEPKSDEQVQRALKKHHLPDRYLLSVGSVIERKRLRSTIRALGSPRLRKDAPPLVVIGHLGSPYAREAQQDVRELGLESKVLFRPEVTHEDLPAITQGAVASLYPSVFEGFGIPIAEALFSGVPVVTSKFSCLPEVVGPGGLCVNPDDGDEYAHAIERMLSDSELRAQIIERGRKHAQKSFEPKALADKLFSYYREAIASG